MDFSAAAKKAFRYALDLAGQYESNIVLMHVIRPSERKDAANLAKQRLAKFCESEGVASKRCKSVVRTGMPFLEITQGVNGDRADLIILGRSDSALGEKLSEGHTLERVLRYATCPVLLVRETGVDFVPMQDGA
jgi:nucleotide-binding universal stress UspA family protein